MQDLGGGVSTLCNLSGEITRGSSLPGGFSFTWSRTPASLPLVDTCIHIRLGSWPCDFTHPGDWSGHSTSKHHWIASTCMAFLVLQGFSCRLLLILKINQWSSWLHITNLILQIWETVLRWWIPSPQACPWQSCNPTAGILAMKEAGFLLLHFSFLFFFPFSSSSNSVPYHVFSSLF